MRIDVAASQRHYAEHVASTWLALPRDVRGRWWVARSIVDDVAAYGIPASAISTGRIPKTGGPVLVASYADLIAARPRPTVMVNHGAGQTYRDVRSGSYSGGDGRGTVVLNVCPGPRDLEIVRRAQPETPAVEAGCAKLDPWHAGDRPSGSGDGTVAVSFHADIPLVPETRTSLWHYERALQSIAESGRYRLLGHGHPRLWRKIRPVWTRLGVEPVREFSEILDRADLYVVDNSSTAYEFASTGRPVLLLNAPWYRRDIDHGLRFWTLVPGLQVDDPRDLPDGIDAALRDPQAARDLRDRAVGRVYAPADGRASRRAADAIVATLGGPNGQPVPASRAPDR